MNQLNIAVIGSGIAGLSAAWLLSKRHRVTVYEPNATLGGHAHTVDVKTPEGMTPVDTGFIVYNEKNYPNLTALFDHLGVESDSTEMSFSLSLNKGKYEYSSTSALNFFGQHRNIVNPNHWRLALDVGRFFRTVSDRINRYDSEITLNAFLQQEKYSQIFIKRHIVPMGAAIWSTTPNEMLNFPARSFVDFYRNHGMLSYYGRTQWRSVSQGSRTYVDKLAEDAGFEVQLNNGVRQVTRGEKFATVVDNSGASRPFDQIVIASHADETLALLQDPSDMEHRLLSQFSYQRNRAVLHRDKSWMPQRKRLWASWNYLRSDAKVEDSLCVTYWMNELQNLNTSTNMFLTLNPDQEVNPEAVDGIFDYDHPVFNQRALEAQKNLWSLQGQNRTWFCGSYFGHGFHEDGAQSGLAVAEELGGVRRPWEVAGESDRIHLLDNSKLIAAQ